MEFTFDCTLKNRGVLKGFLESYTLEHLNKIPEGFSNNIIWNIAHVVSVQQSLVYKLSGLNPLVSEEFIQKYKKGSRPEREVTQAEVEELKHILISTIEKTKSDYGMAIFKQYHEYTVMTGNKLTNVEQALEFNNFHEGVHLGYILALKHAL